MPSGGSLRFFLCVGLALIGGGIFITPGEAEAASFQRANQLKVLSNGQTATLFGGKFGGGSTIAAADTNGDGRDEYVVAAGPTGGPQLEIYSPGGQRVGSFFAYDKKMKDGLNVAAGDLNGDGKAEIVVGPQPGHAPQVQVYSADGKFIRAFTVFESSFAGGVNVAVLPARNGSSGGVIVSSGFGREAEVRFYDQTGKTLQLTWSPQGNASSNGVNVAAGWSDTFGESVAVVGAGEGDKPLVKVYGLNSKQVLAQWLAYDESVRLGVKVAVRSDVVVTGPGVGGGPDVRTFTIRGQLRSSQYGFERNFAGGLNVAATSIDGVIVPAIVPTTKNPTAAGSGKKIVISLSRQQLWLYEKGRVIAVHKISSGKWSTPTPTGAFRTYNKISVAYSKAYGLYMEWWMAFTPDGKNGLHALPFWKLKKSGKLYEGAAHIGTPVSHGCVRQTVADAKMVFDWAPIGTPVIVQP